MMDLIYRCEKLSTIQYSSLSYPFDFPFYSFSPRQFMKTIIQSLFGLVLATVAVNPLFAAPVHVEVLIFSNNTITQDGEWTTIPKELISVEPWTDLSLIENEPSALEKQPEPIDFDDPAQPIPVATTVLKEFAEKIENHPNYQLLNYIGWVQEPEPQSKTKSVSLNVSASDLAFSDQFLLRGESSIYEVAQFMHFAIDVTYTPQPDITLETAYINDLIANRVEPQAAYVLEERRVVRINEVHYFDHPRFGVLFTVIRPKESESSDQ